MNTKPPNQPYCCTQMEHLLLSQEIGLIYIAKYREYGLDYQDGGSAFQIIHFCPWCGTKLPTSLRNEWHDRLEAEGIDALDLNIPIEFESEEWWLNPSNLKLHRDKDSSIAKTDYKKKPFFAAGSKAKLISFQGSQEPIRKINAHENYWILIGALGEIVQPTEIINFQEEEVIDGRVLVRFFANLESLGLSNHNSIKDSLWISESDLELCQDS